MQAAGTLVATRSLKMGTIWQNYFKKKGDFNQKFFAVSPFGEFLPKKREKTARNKLAHFQVLVNHLQTLLTLHQLPQFALYITKSCIVSDTIHQIRWIDAIHSCLPMNDCLELKYQLKFVTERSHKRLQNKPCPSLGLSFYHKFSLKSTYTTGAMSWLLHRQ